MKRYSKHFKRVLAMAMAFVMAVSVITVTPSMNVSAASNKVVKSVTGVAKSKTMTVGQNATFQAKVKATKKVSKKLLQVTVKSNKKNIVSAKVSKSPKKNGKSGASTIALTAKSAGTAVITVTTKAKNKKNKKVVKKMTVTVKEAATTEAPTTEAPTTEAPTTEAPTTEVPVIKLQKISVSADITTITEKGGQAQLSVKSETPGVAISSVSYKSSNEQIATVDENGVVTGVNSAKGSQVTITVTAKDVYGNEAKATIAITVKESEDATMTMLPEKVTLSKGESTKLSASVTGMNGNPDVVWTSGDVSIATVDNEGNVMAVSEGSVVITAKVRGTTVSASCTVTVSDKDKVPGIAAFEAIKADTLQVTFSAAFDENAQKALTITLKTGKDELKPEIEWSENGRTVALKNKTDYSAGTYTVEISGTDVAYNTDKASAECKVEERTIKNVEIPTKSLPVYGNAKICYKAYDQYGEEMQTMTADKFDWKLSCTKTTIKVDNSIKSSGNKYGYVYADLSEGTTNIPSKDEDGVQIKATVSLKTNPDIGCSQEIKVCPLKVKSIEIKGVVGLTDIYESDEDRTVELEYVAKDTEGTDVDLEAYFNKAYNNDITFTSSNEELCSKPVISSEGKLIAKIYKGQNGAVTLMASLGEYISSKSFEVKAKPYPEEVVFEKESYNVIAGEEFNIPVSFKDQYGNDYSNSGVDFETYFTITVGDKDAKATYSDGKIVFDATNLTKKTEVAILVVSKKTLKNVKTSVEVKDPRKASKIVVLTENVKESLMVGETQVIKYKVLDQYDQLWEDDDTWYLDLENDDTYIDASSDTPEKGEGTIFVKAKKVSELGAAQIVTINLKDQADQSLMATNIEYSFKVYQNVETVEATVDKENYTAGEKIKVTLKAKYGENVLTTYNEKFESCYVTNVLNNQYVDIVFENGVATFELEAGKAGEALQYTGEFRSPGNDKDTTFTTNKFKVVPGDVKELGVEIEDDKMTISYIDSKGNVVTTEKGNKKVAITIQDGDDVVRVRDYIAGVDDKNVYIMSVTDGSGTIALNKSIPVGYTVEVSVDDYNGTCKVK